MFNIFVLASFLVFTISVHCQSLARDNDRPSPTHYIFANYDSEEPQEAPREERQLQYYDRASRRTERVPSYQYTSDDNIPDSDYNYPARYQQAQPTTENYPVPVQRDFEQILRNNEYSRLRIPSNKPIVQQYLKEVTPTTKTVYNQRPTNYLRVSGQHSPALKHDHSQESQRNVLKQSPFQFVLQPEVQTKHAPPSAQYELPEAVKPRVPQSQGQIPQPQGIPHLQGIPHAQGLIQAQPQIPQRNYNLVSYQKELILSQQQKQSEADNQDDSSRSSIYVSQNIPKKPIRTKAPKSKPSTADQDPNQRYYAQLQQYQQLLQQQKQVQAQAFEPSPALPVRYQARAQYPKEENTVYQQPQEAEQSAPTYETEEKQPAQYYQPKHQTPKTARPQPSRRPAKYQTEQQEYPTEAVKYQQSPDAYEQYHQSAAKQPKYQQEESLLQYQQRPSSSLRQSPNKYLPEPQKSLRYQPTTLEETPEEKYQANEEARLKYQAPQYSSTTDERASALYQRPRPQAPRYQEEKESAPVRYQLQYPEESQQVSQQQEYKNPEQLVRYRPAGREVAYRQNLQNSNVRYYRNLGRATAYTTTE